MKKRPSFFLQHLFLLALFFSVTTFSGFAAKKEKASREFEISKNLDIFNSLYKELDLFYVDTIQPEKEIRNGIDAMLGNLDPYTTYIPESEMEDLKFMTTGEYAGIGAMIGQKDERTVITEIYEGMPAYKNGLKAGDVFIEIDGIKIEKKTNSEVTKFFTNNIKSTKTCTKKCTRAVTRLIIENPSSNG